MATISFNAAEVQPSSFDALPAGTYEAVIANSEAKPMKTYSVGFMIDGFDETGRGSRSSIAPAPTRSASDASSSLRSAAPSAWNSSTTRRSSTTSR